MAIVPARNKEAAPTKAGSNVATFGFEITTLIVVGKFCRHTEAILGLIILKYVSGAEAVAEDLQ